MINAPYLSDGDIQKFIESALAEDIGPGDYSTLGAFPHDKLASAQLYIKDNGILAGVELAQRIFYHYDPGLVVTEIKPDGSEVTTGDIGFKVEGSIKSILTTERLVLNCMQRMSGIATHTRRLCSLLEGTSARLMDTRKTTPNFRLCEKWAVAIGGGMNHRFALYDMIMLKDNHIDAAGGIRAAIQNVRNFLSLNQLSLKIEVETRTLEEVSEAVSSEGVEVVMLDNMDLDQMRKAVALINKRAKTEASGGITEANLRAVAETGVDFISVGALTHSSKSLDMSLKVRK